MKRGPVESLNRLMPAPGAEHDPLPEGHRERLRQRFAQAPAALPDVHLLELLLSYAIPRRDVRPLAKALWQRYGSWASLLQASAAELQSTPGVGDGAALFVRALDQVYRRLTTGTPVAADRALESDRAEATQAPLFEPLDKPIRTEPPKAEALHVYANDEIENALRFLPLAWEMESYDAFRGHLRDHLPYNAESTRERRTNYLLLRYFPDGALRTPLAYFARAASAADLRPALFYETLRAEPLVARVAEGVVWPALPQGFVAREDLAQGVLALMPQIGPESLKKILLALTNAYSLLDVAARTESGLRLQVHRGTPAAFAYVLLAECPAPGMYPFERLEQGPMRRWLLWERDWMREQLYRLRDSGVISKVSEIDTMRQFTLPLARNEALQRFVGAVAP